MYFHTLESLHIVYLFLLFIEPLIDSARLIGIVYLMSFCGYINSTLVNVNTPKPSAFMKKISRINWIWPNNIKVNHDVVFDTVSVFITHKD